LVVRNDEEQYSIWPSDLDVPAGWQQDGPTGSEDVCLAYVGRVWTDLRPRSLRKTRELAGKLIKLREISRAEAAKLLDERTVRPAGWAAGYPMDGTRRAASGLLEATDARPGFGMYAIVLDNLVIGDIGIKGAPVEGVIEIGYGLVPDHRGHGYATDAAITLTRWALEQPGVTEVVASTDEPNKVSQGVLIRAGFALQATENGLCRYASGVR
jgi:uncharacterized protein YbdZ (MbtH family)